eukprot:gene7530-11536_t
MAPLRLAVLTVFVVLACATTEEDEDARAFYEERREKLRAKGLSEDVIEQELALVVGGPPAHGAALAGLPTEPAGTPPPDASRKERVEVLKKELERVEAVTSEVREVAKRERAEFKEQQKQQLQQDLTEGKMDAAIITAVPVPIMKIPDKFQIVYETDVVINGQLGDVVINVTSSLAPLGAEQLYKLMKINFYDGSCFYRVVPEFIVQWGVAADPVLTKDWSVPIIDDPVEVSNEEGTFVFASAGRDSRTTHLFVNLVNNPHLDSQNFAPL